ncbi:MAG: DNA-binding protein [Bacteroidetes bacterium GWC2_33_15]|nr:MAG: DNA-binding protein [Bacteroidetes bacterium GWA2_33_15]OFX50293.1 MAG: DNA-binding protein [Bacteroidetes bacterium GWC2_33_15]OFX66789.1 MAG: DNA-binding protein [Bacteroidetes bacterium GWB2_32_14]OFX69408.1 MAG: DNA-binding protein [Bacteroidetes bacterium GWD2_33_33]HAN18732.1 redox-sensing transcriptional repressor Rex [Bacteroidales bacterium]
MNKLPEKTIGRLSEYRRTLLICLAKGKTHIFSHELANLHHITAVQVRRDIMLIGYSTTLKKGYDVKALIDVIAQIIDTDEGLNAAVIGAGNLGRAIITYFNGKRTKLRIAASFDVDTEKANRVIAGVKCYPMTDLNKIVKELNIRIGIITVPPEDAVSVAENLVNSGIKGILNYTSTPLSVPQNVYLEEYDMITSLEKVAYFVKQKK